MFSPTAIKNHVADMFGIMPKIKVMIVLFNDNSLRKMVIVHVIIPIIPNVDVKVYFFIF